MGQSSHDCNLPGMVNYCSLFSISRESYDSVGILFHFPYGNLELFNLHVLHVSHCALMHVLGEGVHFNMVFFSDTFLAMYVELSCLTVRSCSTGA